MGIIFSCFFTALSQVGDPAFRGVLIRGVLLTIALLFGIYAGVLGLFQSAFGEATALPLIGEVTWVGDLLGWGSILLMLLLSVFLMVPVASAITSMFLDEVATAVETRHYPHVPIPARLDVWVGLRDTLSFLAVLIAANILAFLLYALVPPLAPITFFAMNGYLLGREYFQIVAMRHLGREGAREMRRANRGIIWLAGILMAVPLVFPILNLIIPILGAATFTHLFHRLQGSPSG